MAWSFGSGRLHDVHKRLLRVRRQGRRHPVVVVREPGPLHEGFCRPRAGSASQALVGNDLQVSEIPAGAVPHPQADQSLRAVAQLGDHQTGLFRVADEDAHVGTRDDDAHMEPSVASDVKLDGPVTELDPFEFRHALTGLLVEPNTLPGPIAQSTHAAVEDLDVVGLDGSLLSRDAGSSKQDDKSRHVHRRSPPYWAPRTTVVTHRYARDP